MIQRFALALFLLVTAFTARDAQAAQAAYFDVSVTAPSLPGFFRILGQNAKINDQSLLIPGAKVAVDEFNLMTVQSSVTFTDSSPAGSFLEFWVGDDGTYSLNGQASFFDFSGDPFVDAFFNPNGIYREELLFFGADACDTDPFNCIDYDYEISNFHLGVDPDTLQPPTRWDVVFDVPAGLDLTIAAHVITEEVIVDDSANNTQFNLIGGGDFTINGNLLCSGFDCTAGDGGIGGTGIFTIFPFPIKQQSPPTWAPSEVALGNFLVGHQWKITTSNVEIDPITLQPSPGSGNLQYTIRETQDGVLLRTITSSYQIIPEPSTLPLLTMGVGVLLVFGRRRKSRVI